MPFIGELSALATAFLWAVTSLWITTLAGKIGSVQTNILRMGLALGFFLATMLIFQLPVHLSASQWGALTMSAVVGIVFGDTFLFKAFQQIGARVTMLMMSLSPAIAALLAYLFLHETLSPSSIVGILVTSSGIALVIFERAPQSAPHRVTPLGLLYAFLGAFGQGGGIVCARFAFAAGSLNGLVAAFVRIGVAMLILLPLAAATGRLRNPRPAFAQERRLFGLLFLVALVGTYGGITLSLVAVEYAKVGIASTLIGMSPVLMLPLVKMLNRETLSWKAISGAWIAVGGVAILFLL